MFEDILIENKDANDGTKEIIIKTRRYDFMSMDMKESHVSGDHIAEGFESMLKLMGIPLRVKFELRQYPNDVENKWLFRFNFEEENNE